MHAAVTRCYRQDRPRPATSLLAGYKRGLLPLRGTGAPNCPLAHPGFASNGLIGHTSRNPVGIFGREMGLYFVDLSVTPRLVLPQRSQLLAIHLQVSDAQRRHRVELSLVAPVCPSISDRSLSVEGDHAAALTIRHIAASPRFDVVQPIRFDAEKPAILVNTLQRQQAVDCVRFYLFPCPRRGGGKTLGDYPDRVRDRKPSMRVAASLRKRHLAPRGRPQGVAGKRGAVSARVGDQSIVAAIGPPARRSQKIRFGL